MSRRFGWLAVVTLVLAGWISWLMTPHPVAADGIFSMGSAPPEAQPHKHAVADGFGLAEGIFGMGSAPPEAQAHKTERPIPPPPAGRKQGIFDLSTTNKAEEKIQAALVNPKGVEIEFIDTPLADAMQFLSNANNIAILLDEQALTEEGIAVDEPLNRTLSGIKLESALKIMLNPLSLTYLVEDEVLKVTTMAVANKKQSTRIYNTGYLKQIGIEPAALMQTIQMVIEPGSWQYGATSAREMSPYATSPQAKPAKVESKPQNAINVLGDMVVVSAPQSIHRKINELLAQLDRRWELQQTAK